MKDPFASAVAEPQLCLRHIGIRLVDAGNDADGVAIDMIGAMVCTEVPNYKYSIFTTIIDHSHFKFILTEMFLLPRK